MTKRFAPVVFAGLTLVGCAAPAPSQEQAMDPELAQTWQAIEDTVTCDQANRECIIDAGLNPFDQARCATDLVECVTESSLQAADGIVACTFEDLGCTIESAASVDAQAIVDCQQDVLDCVEGNVEDLTGVDFTPVLDLTDEIVDGAQDVVDDVVDDVEDVVGDTVDNVFSQLECNQQAAECLAEAGIFNFSGVRACRIEFVECSVNVVENVVEDAVEIVLGDADCRDVYADCREAGGTIRACADERRACEDDK